MVEHKGVCLSLEAHLSLPQTSQQRQKSVRHHACQNGEARRCQEKHCFFPDSLETQAWETAGSGSACQAHSWHTVDDQDGLVCTAFNSTVLTVAAVVARHFGGSTPSIGNSPVPRAPLTGHASSQWGHWRPQDLVPAVKALGAPKGNGNISAGKHHQGLGQMETGWNEDGAHERQEGQWK